METWGDLLRWNAAEGRYYTLDNCYKGPYYGATTQECDTYFNCSHPNTTRTYRAATSGYSVKNGIGYWGYDESPSVVRTCT
jgi:hypothetical protein